MRLFILLISFSLVHFNEVLQYSGSSQVWSYKEGKFSPSKWSNASGNSCGGYRQSPIDIDSDLTMFKSTLSPIRIIKTGSNPATAVLKNTGKSLSLSAEFSRLIKFGDDGELVPVQIHWHWGSNDTEGSEHTLDGKRSVAEAHIVCYNNLLYDNFKTAAKSPNGLYVIGFFYHLGKENIGLGSVLKLIPNVRRANKHMEIPAILLESLIPTNLEEYFRYNGSLTTPPCTENVIWTVLANPVSIGYKQLAAFRYLFFEFPDLGKHLQGNFRPLQSVGERQVYINF